MSKTEETELFLKYVNKIKAEGLEINDTVFLADIAKSLAIIADKLCGAEMEEVEDGKTNNL